MRSLVRRVSAGEPLDHWLRMVVAAEGSRKHVVVEEDRPNEASANPVTLLEVKEVSDPDHVFPANVHLETATKGG